MLVVSLGCKLFFPFQPDEVESIRLGPGGRGLSSWGRGSSGGTKSAAEDVKTALTANRYVDINTSFFFKLLLLKLQQFQIVWVFFSSLLVSSLS